MVSDLIHLDQDKEGHLRAFKVTGLDHLDSGELFLECDLKRSVMVDHGQQTDGHLFQKKHKRAIGKGYKGLPDSVRSHQCHLYKRHSGDPQDKICLVRYAGRVGIFDRSIQAPSYLKAMVAIYDDDSFLVSWLPGVPANGVHSMLYKRINMPSSGPLNITNWWKRKPE